MVGRDHLGAHGPPVRPVHRAEVRGPLVHRRHRAMDRSHPAQHAHPMRNRPLTYPTFARELLEARDALTVGMAAGLALRATRRRLGMSQREYAAVRGWSSGHASRLEVGADGLRLTDVVAALEGTGYVLALCRVPEQAPDDPFPAGCALPVPVAVHEWPRSELVARVRGRTRRFPAHHRTRQTTDPPPWWWTAESTRAGKKPPHWYAPRPDPFWDDREQRRA